MHIAIIEQSGTPDSEEASHGAVMAGALGGATKGFAS